MGSAIGPVALGLVADLYGLDVPFYATGALMFLTAGTTQFFVKETLKTKSKKS
jgi:predicted MFS family arabinose efflux permease